MSQGLSTCSFNELAWAGSNGNKSQKYRHKSECLTRISRHVAHKSRNPRQSRIPGLLKCDLWDYMPRANQTKTLQVKITKNEEAYCEVTKKKKIVGISRRKQHFNCP